MARFVVGVMAKGGAGADFEFVMVNGAPGWVLSRNGAPFAVAAIETDGEKMRKVFATLNQDKLAHVQAAARRERVGRTPAWRCSGMHTCDARLTSDARKNIFRFSELCVMMPDWMEPARRSGRSLARPKAGGENGEAKWLSSP